MSQQRGTVCIVDVGRRAVRRECDQALAFARKRRIKVQEEQSGSSDRRVVGEWLCYAAKIPVSNDWCQEEGGMVGAASSKMASMRMIGNDVET